MRTFKGETEVVKTNVLGEGCEAQGDLCVWMRVMTITTVMMIMKV